MESCKSIQLPCGPAPPLCPQHFAMDCGLGGVGDGEMSLRVRSLAYISLLVANYKCALSTLHVR